MNSNNYFTVVIPTYNSSKYLKECIYGFKNSKYLNEILIGDDCSDNKEIVKIKQIIEEANKYFDFEIEFIESKLNNGAFKNKYNLIKSSKNKWVYQIDSDNVPFPKIDKVISNIIENHNSHFYIYYPSKLIQFRRFKKIAKLFSKFQKKYIVKFSNDLKIFDLTKTQKAINEFLNSDSSRGIHESQKIKSNFVLDKHIYWVLNCGNFIVNKEQFVNATTPGLNFSREILAMDAVAFSYLWLQNKGSIVLHPELGHFHRKRFDSVSYIEKESSKISRQFFTEKILSLM